MGGCIFLLIATLFRRFLTLSLDHFQCLGPGPSVRVESGPQGAGVQRREWRADGGAVSTRNLHGIAQVDLIKVLPVP